jgi:hypothetical protein
VGVFGVLCQSLAGRETAVFEARCGAVFHTAEDFDGFLIDAADASWLLAASQE